MSRIWAEGFELNTIKADDLPKIGKRRKSKCHSILIETELMNIITCSCVKKIKVMRHGDSEHILLDPPMPHYSNMEAKK